MFNICIIGPTNSGKSAWITRLIDGMYSEEKRDAIDTLGVIFNTTMGEISFNFFEMHQNHNWESYDGAIIFHDRTTKTFPIPSIPQVHVLSFADQYFEYTTTSWGKAPNKKYWISAKSCYNLEKPLLEMMQKLVDPAIQLAEEQNTLTGIAAAIQNEFNNAPSAPSNPILPKRDVPLDSDEEKIDGQGEQSVDDNEDQFCEDEEESI